ncbi:MULTISPECIES: DUF4044 domain-containing protein [Carnobacterium]|uniref:DUF4044 domain-containing protein n=1 Tax=Carnobacterium divergens TaxID=2748 RepID=A0A2R8A1L0_CARDV|nr:MULTISPECIES: DUF4044 domain-containing protein [Carnobacterium]MCO6017316.1 DUF4044 domain-containing protein [Carnobacterium divergens]MDO0874205.1 DUF4044 domain-containing protein [Carnobacterium divergens]MDT1939269.1 DUF4044 domain-containing protein [Carnobacterium divergens]MDT1941707.1 DUF4044 domain-containing protein [Carnobacterium divergens]MDT1947505.1 DUF4044 domain-containing protein [Carnobacterium divergens]
MKNKDIYKTSYKKKQPTKMEKITKIVVWIMLFAMIGSGVLSVVYTLFFN